MTNVEVSAQSRRDAQDALDALYATKLSARDDAPPVFDLKEIKTDDRPVLIQCCIR